MKDIVVYLYEVEFDKIKDNEVGFIEMLPVWRREKVERIQNEEARIMSLASGLVLKKVLGDAVNEVFVGEYGKPDSTADGVYFNLSHSGGVVGVAVAKECVGLDIECKDDGKFRISGRMFCEKEKRAVESCRKEFGDEMAQELFRLIWTRKEAYLKCKGIGISIPLRSFLTLSGMEPTKENIALMSEEPKCAEIMNLAEDEDGLTKELAEDTSLYPAEESTGYYVKSFPYCAENEKKFCVSVAAKKIDFSLDIVILQSI